VAVAMGTARDAVQRALPRIVRTVRDCVGSVPYDRSDVRNEIGERGMRQDRAGIPRFVYGFLAGAVVLLPLTAASCGGGDGKKTTTTTTTSSRQKGGGTTTTKKATTTTKKAAPTTTTKK
jgi:hypothetical protein